LVWNGNLEHTDYNPSDSKNHYDRETIFTSDNKNLFVTIEDYDIKDISSEIKSSCKYGIELSIGILGKRPQVLVSSFIENSEYFIPKIAEELDEFKEFCFCFSKTKYQNFI